jgi:hypothetical protein
MNIPQRRLLVGTMVLSAILLLVGLNALDVDNGKLRTTLTFVVCPLLVVAAKFLHLGWRDLQVKILGMNGLFVIGAILLHLMFTDYTTNTSYKSSLGFEFIEDRLEAEPGVSIWLGKWIGLILPSILGPVFGIRHWVQSMGMGPGEVGGENLKKVNEEKDRNE